jgi:hypothetical protein
MRWLMKRHPPVRAKDVVLDKTETTEDGFKTFTMSSCAIGR